VNRTSLDHIDFNHRQGDYKSTDLDYRMTTKKRCWATEWLAAPPIKWGLSWKQSEIVQRTSLDHTALDHRPGDYKTIDLDYKILEKDYKIAELGHRNGLQHYQ
jgi:hypothetical protein